eukprot:CAMPEP_0117006904 /NCGR_PEP_ID=MMETSP0472-20121206/6971_1 /TAXON_ID=693140 ORGANISM="Tiarina fusus, Strain LIS" /NCGR_SAMPLE_ID=MMETSP0472 /ASSEMBLY_ACC=CAM_ASM_000603 /LENGTH=111 /DNA_ID=CAMNT_0004708513 /DNA_START=12 /DNA_END=347 /DNA_ORIENTATION=+
MTSFAVSLALFYSDALAQNPNRPPYIPVEDPISYIEPTVSSLFDTVTESVPEVIVYIPFCLIILAFFLGVVLSLLVVLCALKKKQRKAYSSPSMPLAYEQLYPVEDFAQNV